MKFQSNTVTWKCKNITAPAITICRQFLKTDCMMHNTIFSLVWCMRLEWCTNTAMYYVTISPHFSNKQFCRLFAPSVWQNLETVNSKVMKLLLLHWIIEYITANASLWKNFISITYTLCKMCCIYVQTYKLITQWNRRHNFSLCE